MPNNKDYITQPPKKSLGQNFLTSPIVPNWLCEAGAVTPHDRVFEIGPGTGVLTRVLLERGAEVTILETDKRLIPLLEREFATYLSSQQLRIVVGDARTINFKDVVPATPYKIIANIPYYLSGFLLRRCLEITPPPTTLVFLMQKELVTRIARDKKSSLASLSVQAFGIPHYYKTVSRGHFSPSPRVDSAILQVTNISHNNFTDEADREQFFTLLHTAFGQKRKQLAHTLMSVIEREKLTTICTNIGIPITSRPEELSLETWLSLYRALRRCKQ